MGAVPGLRFRWVAVRDGVDARKNCGVARGWGAAVEGVRGRLVNVDRLAIEDKAAREGR